MTPRHFRPPRHLSALLAVPVAAMALTLLIRSGLPVAYWPAAVDVAALLALTGWALVSAAVTATRRLRSLARRGRHRTGTP